MMVLDFKAVPADNLHQMALGGITYAGITLKVSSVVGDVISLEMNEELSIADHKLALSMAAPTEVFTLIPVQGRSKPKPKLRELNLDAVDLVNFESKRVPVWDNLFKKPAPVFDRGHWAATEESDSYIYIPNCTKYSGEETEDFNSNAMYTQIMLNAYKLLGKEVGINPVVRLCSGVEMLLKDVEPRHSVRNDTAGERAAGLANSTLVDFDDSKYGTAFLDCVVRLDSRHVAKEPARRTVLAKCEYIFAGKMSHTYNQRFVASLLEAISGGYESQFSEKFGSNAPEVQACLVGILRAMVMDGFVLEESISVFESKLWAANLGDSAEFLMEIYTSV